MTETCDTCRFWKATRQDEALGTCHRAPPVIVERMLMAIGDLRVGETLVHRAHQASMFPITYEEDWCGKYKPSSEELQRRSDEWTEKERTAAEERKAARASGRFESDLDDDVAF